MTRAATCQSSQQLPLPDIFPWRWWRRSHPRRIPSISLHPDHALARERAGSQPFSQTARHPGRPVYTQSELFFLARGLCQIPSELAVSRTKPDRIWLKVPSGLMCALRGGGARERSQSGVDGEAQPRGLFGARGVGGGGRRGGSGGGCRCFEHRASLLSSAAGIIELSDEKEGCSFGHHQQ